MNTILDNQEKKRFEMKVDNHIAFVEYIKTNDKFFLTHTEVPTELEGQGIASNMVKQVLEIVEKTELSLIPLCPFVAGYIKKHPEWKKLVFKGVNIN